MNAAERQRRYRERHPERVQQIKKKFRERHHERLLAEARERRRREPEKFRARDAVKRALRDGRLIRGTCERGGDCKGPIQAHHDDYSKPLDVRWLCQRHHQQEDAACASE